MAQKKKPRIASRLLYGGYTDADVSSSSIRLLSLFLKIWIFWCCFLICALSSLSRGVSNTPRIKKSRVVFSEMATSTNKSMEAVPSPRSIFPKWRSLIFSFTANCSYVKPLVLRSCWIRLPVAYESKYIGQPSDHRAAQPIATPQGRRTSRHSAAYLTAGTRFVLDQFLFYDSSSFLCR